MVLDSLSTIPDLVPSTKRKSNISKAENEALNALKNDVSIVIKAADKGGTTVIMDKAFYKEKILELLSDTENYMEIPNNEDDNIMKKIKKRTDEHKYELNKKEMDYIQNFKYKTSNFYCLPKIQKSKLSNQQPNNKTQNT